MRNINKYIRKGRELIPSRKQLDEEELEALVNGSGGEEALAERAFMFGACVGYDWAVDEQRAGKA